MNLLVLPSSRDRHWHSGCFWFEEFRFSGWNFRRFLIKEPQEKGSKAAQQRKSLKISLWGEFPKKNQGHSGFSSLRVSDLIHNSHYPMTFKPSFRSNNEITQLFLFETSRVSSILIFQEEISRILAKSLFYVHLNAK